MRVTNATIMIPAKLTCLLLFVGFCAVRSYPSTPLNERSKEISWQAWLLVDDHNQNRPEGGDAIPKKKITPKSVFVAPTFSPESLPPCAEGYSSDSMGRCIKIIKLDEDKHLEFLINKINDKFGSVDYEEDIEIEEIDVNKDGPIQFSIPLGGDDYDYDSSQDRTNLAIIVTPSGGSFDTFDTSGLKLDKRDDDVYESTSTVEYETTTVAEELTTSATESYTTVTTDSAEDTTEVVTEETTTPSTDTTTLREESETQTTLKPVPTSTTPKITTYHPHLDTTRLFIRSPDKSGNLIQFPDLKNQQESQSHHTRDVSSQYGNFLNEHVPRKTAENRKVFLQRKPVPYGRTFGGLFSDDHARPINNGNVFFLPPNWASKPPRRSMVLRFSGKRAFIDTKQFKNNEFYRSLLPADDLSYLFGYKRKRSNRR